MHGGRGMKIKIRESELGAKAAKKIGFGIQILTMFTCGKWLPTRDYQYQG